MKLRYILIAVILLSLIFFVATKWMKKSLAKKNSTGIEISRFQTEDTKTLFPILVSKFGQPNVVINQKGGFCLWFPNRTNPQSVYDSIILKDEEIPHETHNDCLYMTVTVDIPEEKMADIHNLGLFYNRKNNELIARCNNLSNTSALIDKALTIIFTKDDSV